MARIDLIIGVKNAMKAGLAKAKESFAKFGAAAVNATKQIAKGFMAASAAAIAFATKAVQAYAKQEGSERQLQAAIEASGESYQKAAPELLKLAAAIQDETGAADEATIANMALLKTLGIMTDQLPQAAKGMIALESVGLKGESAARALANAMQGNYTALQRYIPALKNAQSEEEKQAVLNEFLARGYKIQADQLNTVGGQWNQLKNRLGDAMEAIGGAIVESRGLTETMKQLGEWVKVTTERFTDWLKGGGIDQINAAIKNIIDTIKKVIDLRFEIALTAITAATVAAAVKVAGFAKKMFELAQAIKATKVAATGMDVANKAIAASAGKTVTSLVAMKAASLALAAVPWAAIAIGVAAIGHAAIEAHKAFLDLNKATASLAKTEAGIFEKYGTRTADELINARNAIAGTDPKLKAAAERLYPKLAAAMKEAARAAEDQAKAQDDTKKAIEAKAAAEVSYKDLLEMEKQLSKQIAEDEKKRAQEKKDLQEKEKQLAEEVRDIQLAALEAEKDAIEDAAKARLDGFAEQQAEAQKVADIGIQGILAEKQAAMEKTRQAERDAKKASRLSKTLQITGKLSKKDQDFLDAFNKAKNAEEAINVAQQNIAQGLGIGDRVADINRQIADLAPTERKLDEVKNELALTRKMLDDNLKWG